MSEKHTWSPEYRESHFHDEADHQEFVETGYLCHGNESETEYQNQTSGGVWYADRFQGRVRHVGILGVDIEQRSHPVERSFLLRRARSQRRRSLQRLQGKYEGGVLRG